MLAGGGGGLDEKPLKNYNYSTVLIWILLADPKTEKNRNKNIRSL